MSKTIAIDDPAAVALASDCLCGGGVIILPTDTVYGIAASLSSAPALSRLFEAKGRSSDKTLPILLASPDQLSLVATGASERAIELARHFWPGPLTVVLPARPGLPSEVLAEDHTVGVRIPDHSFARAVIAAAGGALAVTSANRSGYPPALDAPSAATALGDQVDATFDGGSVAGGVPSTVVRIKENNIEILREGAISPETIRRFWYDLQG